MRFFGVNFILQKFCQCKKNDKYQVWKREQTKTQHDMIVTTAQLPKSQNPSDTAAQRTKNEWRWMNIVLTKFHSIS